MDANRPSSNHHHSTIPSPSGRLVHCIEDLKALQWEIPLNTDDLAKDPEPEMFPKFPSCTILEPEIDQDREHCVILLHDKGQNEKSLKDLARRLRKYLPESVFLLLRGPIGLYGNDQGYQWTHSERHHS